MVLTIIIALVGVLIGLLVYLSHRSMVRPANFPPGPLGIPILGSLHLLKEYPERDMLKLAKKYGNIFSLKTAAKNYVCVCGTDLNKEVLYHKDVINRPDLYAFLIVKRNDSKGITARRYSNELILNREFMHSVLTDVQKVDFNIDEIVEKEITSLMDKFENMFESCEPEYVSDVILALIIDTFLSIYFGHKTDKTIEEKYKRDELIQNLLSLRAAFEDVYYKIPDLIPGIHKVWLPNSAKKFISAGEGIFKYCTDQLEDHKNSWDPEKPRDMVDLYLNKMNEEKELQDPVFTKVNFQHLLFDILLGGFENSAHTLGFAVLYLAAHPSVQSRLHKEIIQVLGPNGKVQCDDITRMDFTNATACEIFRFASTAAVGVTRETIKDVTIRGYSIPKGTTFMFNQWSSNTQDDRWKNPKHFDPENFLDENGKFVSNNALMPFGGGLRSCIGASLPKRQLFVFLVKLIQKFHIKPETDDTKVDCEPIGGFIHSPKPQKLRLQLREIDY
ncbi:cytochrome P450 2D28-like [Styela clava]